MARKIISIEQYIGGWGYNKEMLRLDLEGTETDGAVLEIASLGGSLFDAINMYNQIARHGNVEVVFVGPSASAATVLAMSAKKVSIVDNSFVLIHKVMSIVDNFGTFNEDDLDKLIEDLQVLRTENQKFDVAIARIYSKRSGKTIADTIEIMKTGTWLTSAEAKEQGLVDEIVEPQQKWNYFTERFVAMVQGNNLPDIPKQNHGITASPDHPITESPDHSITGSPDHRITGSPDHSITESQISKIMKQFTNLNRVLEVEELQASGEGCYLNEEQLDVINAALSEAVTLAGANSALNTANEALQTNLSELNETIASKDAEIAAKVAELETLNASISEARNRCASLQDSLTAAESQLTENFRALGDIDETVAAYVNLPDKVAAIRALLAVAPGAVVPGTLSKTDSHKKADGVDWELINSLPHNREADLNK